MNDATKIYESKQNIAGTRGRPWWGKRDSTEGDARIQEQQVDIIRYRDKKTAGPLASLEKCYNVIQCSQWQCQNTQKKSKLLIQRGKQVFKLFYALSYP